MKGKHRISKKLIFYSAALTLFAAAYLHFGLCPGKLKDIVTERLEEATHKKIIFRKMLYLPFRGLAFDDLIVGDLDGHLLFSTKQLAIDVKLLPFLRENKIVVRNLYLDHPLYDHLTEKRRSSAPPPAPVMTRMSGQIQVPVSNDEKKITLEDISGGPEAFLPENVYIEDIRIVDGRVRIRKNMSVEPSEEIRAINVDLSFRRPPVISFDGSFDLGKDSYSTVDLRGGWDLEKASYEFILDVRSRRVPEWLVHYQKKNLVSLEKGRSHLKVKLRSLSETMALFDLSADLQEASLRLQKTFYDGRFGVEAKGLFNFDSRSFDRYQGKLKLMNVNVRNLTPQITSLDNVKAAIRFQPDLLNIEEASGEYRNVPFALSGQIKPFRDPMLTARIEVNSSIEEILKMLPDEQKKFAKSFELGGICHAVTTLYGPLKPGVPLAMDYKLVVSKGFIRSLDKKIDLANLSAEILMDGAGLRILRSGFLMGKQNYELDGFLPKDPKTNGNLSLSSKDLSLSAEYLFDGQNAVIQAARAEYLGLRAKFKGRLVNISNPYLDVDGDALISLEALSLAMAPKAAWLKDAGLKGTLEGYFQMKGFLNKPLEWDLKMDAGGDPIFIKKTIRLDKFDMQIRMKDKILNIPYIHTDSYGGKTTAGVAFDFRPAKATFDAKVGSSNFDITAFARDFAPDKKDLTGTGVFNVILRGVLGAPETIRGSGSIDIQNGTLWKTDEFKQMGELPFVRVEGLDWVTFTRLSSVFSIRDKKVWTDNLQLMSDTVNLSMHGTIGFDQTVDMLMDIHYSNDVFQGASDAGGLAPFMVSKAAGMISQYKLSGPLKSPKSEKLSKLPII